MNKARLTHIDNAKAIGMMLIVASHVVPTKEVVDGILFQTWDGLINSFYVPLFFILSGVFQSSSTDYKKLGRRILILVRYCAIFYVFGIITDGLINNNWSLSPHKTTIWFLFTLLWITAIWGVLKNLKYNYLIYVLLIMCVGGGIYASYNSHSYMYLGQACLCLPFYLVGYYAKDFLKNTEFRWQTIVLSFSCWILFFMMFYNCQNVAMNMVGQNYPAFYIEAFAGSMFLIELCKLFHNKFFSYYGKNTIIPMMTQFALIWIVKKIVCIDSMLMFYTVALFVIVLTTITIPLFKNKIYNVFK